ncbi:nucleoside triphosphate pyrophosphohydrolase [Thermodesulfobacteriota bacterium]
MSNQNKVSKSFADLVDLVETLRGPNGCPWDRKQTISSVKMYLLEECYEVLDAIEKGDSGEECLELGDLLFMIIFLARLSSEKGEFDIVDVIENIVKKMKNRHPHVFGDVQVNGPDEVSSNWQKLKMKEKVDIEEKASLLRDVPTGLPALLRAHRLSDKASKVGFDWNNKSDIWEKVKEEFNELSSAVSMDKREEVEEELGDLIFSLVNLARHWGFNSENVLSEANRKFLNRFERMEKRLDESGPGLDSATPEEMNSVWNSIKDKTGK